MAEKLALQGTESLTINQARALAAAAQNTLMRIEFGTYSEGEEPLTPREQQHCRQALEKLLTALDWQTQR